MQNAEWAARGSAVDTRWDSFGKKFYWGGSMSKSACGEICRKTKIIVTI
jgi:hypothetical protein